MLEQQPQPTGVKGINLRPDNTPTHKADAFSG